MSSWASHSKILRLFTHLQNGHKNIRSAFFTGGGQSDVRNRAAEHLRGVKSKVTLTALGCWVGCSQTSPAPGRVVRQAPCVHGGGGLGLSLQIQGGQAGNPGGHPTMEAAAAAYLELVSHPDR